MTDAINRAAEALERTVRAYPTGPRDPWMGGQPLGATMSELARAALTAALSDREGMARVLAEHQARGFRWRDECRCGWPIPSWTDDDGPDGDPIERPDRRRHLDHQIDALATHLLGGES
jgi:hypothetical protein